MMASTSYGATAQTDLTRAACAEVKTLTVDKLKKVLRTESLLVSGVKNELQMRMIAHVERCAAGGDYAKIERIRNQVRGQISFTSNSYPSPHSLSTPTSSLSPQFASPTPRGPTMPPYAGSAMYSHAASRITFKSSPFYTIIKPLGPLHELKAREQTRDTKKVEVKLDGAAIDQLGRDPNIRIMVFCAAESYGNVHEPVDISFPQHGELKCNEAEVKHNLKGMKNKPGTTRPADITSHLRKATTYPNSVDLVYALTTKRTNEIQKYYLLINMVAKKTIGELVKELQIRKTPFTKERVLQDMRKQANDPDIVATSSVMSLKDPLEMSRIKTPCRSQSCTHNGCFDAAAFLALQEQAPTWSCPLCNKPARWENLAFDEYFNDILQNAPKTAEQVTIEPDGRWHSEAESQTQNNGGRGDTATDDDDDDIVEITDNHASGSRDSASAIRQSSFTTNSPTNGLSTPTSGPISAGPPRSNKRPHAETIDLTLDSDEEEEQPPTSRVKRTSGTSTTPDLYRTQPITHEPYRFAMPPPSPNMYNGGRYGPNYQ